MLEAIAYRGSIIRFMRLMRDDPGFRNRYPLGPDSVVLDFGGYDGVWALEMTEAYGCRVHAFEPVPELFAKMAAATADDPRITCWPFGVGATDATLSFSVGGPGSSSVGGAADWPSVEGQVRDVDAALREVGLDHVDLCKLNIEGAEYDVLDRMAETGWFERIDHLQIQFHDTHPDAFARRRRIRRALRRTHDQVWNYDWVFESWTRRP